MADVVLKVGEKVIFDTNDDAGHRDDTYLTCSQTYPENNIEVWVGAAMQAEFREGRSTVFYSGIGLSGDTEIYSSTVMTVKAPTTLTLESSTVEVTGTLELKPDPHATIACPRNITIAMGEGGSSSFFKVTNTGVDLLQLAPGNAVLSGCRLSLASTNAAFRKIDTPFGGIEIAATDELKLQINSQGGTSGAVEIRDHSTLVATVSNSGGATINVDTQVNGLLTATGKVDGSTGGIRTRSVTSGPTGGQAGDMAVRTDQSKLFVNVGGTWKSVVLA